MQLKNKGLYFSVSGLFSSFSAAYNMRRKEEEALLEY